MAMARSSWLRSLTRRDKQGAPRQPARRRRAAPLRLEQLEDRTLLSGTWAPLASNAPANIGTMMLLSDGTVMAQQGGISTTWYQLTPQAFTGSYVNGSWSTRKSMSVPRLYYASNVLPNGNVFVEGGEYTNPQTPNTATDDNRGEIFDPTGNSGVGSWQNIAPFPQTQFGDDPSAMLPDGRVLTGYINGAQTYIYNPSTNAWTSAANKLRSDQSDEESWVKLPNGSILSYDVYSSASTGTFHAQRYDPSTNTWKDASTVSATNPPSLLSSAAIGSELGPAFLLPDGRAIFFGGNGNTAYYTPATDTWSAGPAIPGGLGADDAPGAMMPNGHILIAADTPLFNGPTSIYEFDPTKTTTATAYTNVTPSGFPLSGPSYHTRMLVLPSGQVLLSNDQTNQLDLFSPNEAPNDAWRPTISSIHRGGGVAVTLTGTQINGISEGAAYGDDAEMSSNYPIVQQILPNESDYLRTSNWSSTGVAEGSTPESVQFVLGDGSDRLLRVIANGIASPTALAIEMSPTFNNVTLRVDPGAAAFLQILNNGSIFDAVPFSSFSSIMVTCDSSNDTLTVDYGNGNPIPAGGLNYSFGAGVDTLNVNDQTDAANRTWTIGAGSVQRSGSGPITVSGGINFVNVNGGSGNNLYNVTATPGLSGVTLDTGGGSDTVNVGATDVPLAVNTTTGSGGGDNDQVHLGNAGSMQGILAPVTIFNRPSRDQVFLDNSLDGGNRSVTIGSGGVTGLARAPINFTAFSVATLSLLGGFGTNTYTVNDTPALSMTLDSGSSADHVNVLGTSAPLTVHSSFVDFFNSNTVSVGNAGSLQNILGAVTVTDGFFATTRLNVDDSADTTGRNVALGISGGTSTGTITGLTASGAVITFPQFNLTALTVSGGSGANAYTVSNTGTGSQTTINTGNGNDTVSVEATTGNLAVNLGTGTNTINLSPAAHNLANLAGLVAVNGGPAGTNTLNAFDQATTFAQGSAGDNLYQDHLTRFNPSERTVFTYGGMQSVNISAGRGDSGEEIFGIVSTPAGVPVTLTDASTTSQVEFFAGSPLDSIQGPLNIQGRASGLDELLVDDADNPNPQTYTLTTNTVTGTSTVSRTGMAPITYDNLAAGMNLYTSNTGAHATVNVQGVGATPTSIELLTAGDQANVTAPGIQGFLRILSTGAVPVPVSVTVDDSSDSTPRTATFSTDPNYRYLLNGLAHGPIYLNVDPGSDVQVLGGSGGNTFNMQSAPPGISISLDGGSGTNTLDYTGYNGSVVADLQTGVATGFSSIANIQNLIGASGGAAQGLYNLLIGNGGNVLTGGVGRRNILVAGGSASTLIGGNLDDLLIGGTTSYDTETGLVSWQQIAAYWAGTDPYSTRVSNLESGNGVPLLDASTVTGNGGGNTMTGLGELALIYTDGSDTISGFNAGSQTYPITP
jgi:hypothetical protein